MCCTRGINCLLGIFYLQLVLQNIIDEMEIFETHELTFLLEIQLLTKRKCLFCKKLYLNKGKICAMFFGESQLSLKEYVRF